MEIIKGMLIGGTTLSIGSNAVGRLPANATTANVQEGLGIHGSFYPMIGTLGGASMVYSQLKHIRRV